MGAGKERSAGYGLIYRSFNHGRMKSICAALDVASLSQNLQQQLGRTSVSTDMRAFLSGFAYLQEARHLADYDASAVFPLPAASAFVGAAEVAITTFDQIHPDEKADVLALMLLNPRA
jgi:hypothetical protein